MIMIVKTPRSQMGSPAAAEEGGEEVGGGRWESGEGSEVQARSTLTSTAPKATSRSGEDETREIEKFESRKKMCADKRDSVISSQVHIQMSFFLNIRDACKGDFEYRCLQR